VTSQFTFNEAISFQIPRADQDEVDRYWDRLSDGGQEVARGWQAPQRAPLLGVSR